MPGIMARYHKELSTLDGSPLDESATTSNSLVT
jgi:hypothetical protein